MLGRSYTQFRGEPRRILVVVSGFAARLIVFDKRGAASENFSLFSHSLSLIFGCRFCFSSIFLVVWVAAAEKIFLLFPHLIAVGFSEDRFLLVKVPSTTDQWKQAHVWPGKYERRSCAPRSCAPRSCAPRSCAPRPPS